MRLVLSTARPCQLERGHARRVPQARGSTLIGYHLRCPRCGFVCTTLDGDGLHIKEEQPDEVASLHGVHVKEGAADEVTFSEPIRCTYCQVLLHLTRSELRLEEDVHVRPVQYR